jgi:hypothetical protein
VWLLGGAISTTVPNLFRAVGKQRHGKTVREALDNHRWVQDITGARTTALILEYVDLCETLENVQLSPHESDRFVWRSYRAYFVGWVSMAGAKELWCAHTPPESTLDGETTDATWTSAERKLRLLRPVGRDDRAPIVFLHLRPRGLVPPTQRHDLHRHSTAPDVHPTGLVALGEVYDATIAAQKLRLLSTASDLVPVERTEQAYFRLPGGVRRARSYRPY